MTTTAPGTLVLLRHGESTENAIAHHGGGSELPLTRRGEVQALLAGRVLGERVPAPALIVSSTYLRTRETARLVIDEAGWVVAAPRADARLDARAYGASTDPLDAEPLSRVLTRVRECWNELLFPRLRSDAGPVLVVAHRSTVRAVCAIVDGMDIADAERLDVATARPLLYRVAANGRSCLPGGEWLEEDRPSDPPPRPRTDDREDVS